MARLTPIQIPNRTVPLDQIIAVQGQNPIATGVQDLGNDLGQAITRRNQLMMQGQQLAYLAKQAGTDAPPIGTDPTLFEKSLNYKALAQQRQADAANQRVNEQLALEKLRRGYTEVDPTGKTRYFPGVQGLSIGTDANGNPTIVRDPSYQPGEQPVPRGAGGSGSPNQDEKLWESLVNKNDPATASSRTTLGIASRGNLQADRALQTLNRPQVTKAELGNVMADVAAIYQGGAPTDIGMSHQDWSTLYGKVQGMRQYLTGNPSDVVPDSIKARMLSDINDLKQINSRSISNHLDYTEGARQDLISRHQNEWKALRQRIEGAQTTSPLSSLPPPGAQGSPTLKPLKNSGKAPTMRWNAQTGKVEAIP